MTWLSLTCPLCGHVMGEADSRTKGFVRLRCYNRKCSRPVVMFSISDGKAPPLSMVDRRERRKVS